MTIENVIAPPRGTGQTSWAQILNTSFSAMDAHDHSLNNGEPVDSSIVSFNADFICNSLTSWDYISLSGDTFNDQVTVRSDGLDLIAIDGVGRPIFITKDGALNVATTIGGGFIGDYVSAGARATYTAISNTYTFSNGAAQLSSLTFANARSSSLIFSEIFTCNSFSVSVSAANTILFSLPVLSAGIVYRNAGVLSTTPFLSCDAISTIYSKLSLGSTYASFLTRSMVGCSANVNFVTKYNYTFNQGKGTTRDREVDRQTTLSFPSGTFIPFVECAFQQAAPTIQYAVSGFSTSSGSFRYKDPVIQYTINGSNRFGYNSILGYQVVYFRVDGGGNPVAGGLGG